MLKWIAIDYFLPTFVNSAILIDRYPDESNLSTSMKKWKLLHIEHLLTLPLISVNLPAYSFHITPIVEVLRDRNSWSSSLLRILSMLNYGAARTVTENHYAYYPRDFLFPASLAQRAASIQLAHVNTPPTMAINRISRWVNGTLFFEISTANG